VTGKNIRHRKVVRIAGAVLGGFAGGLYLVQGGAQHDFQGGQVVLVQQGMAAKVAEFA